MTTKPKVAPMITAYLDELVGQIPPQAAGAIIVMSPADFVKLPYDQQWYVTVWRGLDQFTFAGARLEMIAGTERWPCHVVAFPSPARKDGEQLVYERHGWLGDQWRKIGAGVYTPAVRARIEGGGKCAACGGSGQVSTRVGNAFLDVLLPCGACKGTGKVAT